MKLCNLVFLDHPVYCILLRHLSASWLHQHRTTANVAARNNLFQHNYIVQIFSYITKTAK